MVALGNYEFPQKAWIVKSDNSYISKGYNKQDGRLAVLKADTIQSAEQSDRRRCFARECEIMRALPKSDFIVEMLESCQNHSWFFRAYEFCNCGNFSEMMASQNDLELEDFLRYCLKQLLAVLQQFRMMGLVHNNLTGDKLLCHVEAFPKGDRLLIKISDFSYADVREPNFGRFPDDDFQAIGRLITRNLLNRWSGISENICDDDLMILLANRALNVSPELSDFLQGLLGLYRSSLESMKHPFMSGLKRNCQDMRAELRIASETVQNDCRPKGYSDLPSFHTEMDESAYQSSLMMRRTQFGDPSRDLTEMLEAVLSRIASSETTFRLTESEFEERINCDLLDLLETMSRDGNRDYLDQGKPPAPTPSPIGYSL